MNTYKIEITETLQKQIDMQAESIDDALQQVRTIYDEEKIILDSNDFKAVKFSSLVKRQ